MKEITIVLLGVTCIALIVEGASHLGTRVAEKDWERRTAAWRAEWAAYEAAKLLADETRTTTVMVTDPADK